MILLLNILFFEKEPVSPF